MGIVNNFLIKSAKSGNIKGVKLALSLNNVTNNLKKLFSKVNPFRNTESFNMNNDQVLNYALRYVVNSLDHDAMVSLINAGANVNAIGSDGVKSIIYKYERALAQREEDLPVQAREFFTEYREKCCLVLGELIMHDAMPKNDEEKKSILKIFKEEKGFNEFMEVVKLKLKASPPKKPPRTFEYKPTNTGSMYVEVNNMMPPKKPPRTFEYQPKNTNDDLLSKEPIYAEVYDSKVNNSLKESGHLNISKEPIYADVYDSRKESTENLPLKDSGYFSVEDKHVYEEIDHFKDDEHIYEEIDHFKKDNDLYDSGYSSVDESIYAESDVRNLKNPLYVSAEECKTQKRSVGSSQQEPIYAKVDLAAKKQKATPTKDTKTQFDDEHVYEEIDHFKKDNDLYDSGYSSVDESIYAESDVRNLKNPLYVSAEECKTQKESVDSLQQGYTKSDVRNPLYVSAEECKMQKGSVDSSQQEPIYAQVDLSKKRAGRNAKDIKANSGTYNGLVQDKVSQWQERIELSEQNSSRLINQQQASNKKVKTKAGFSVEEIKQKHERKNLGYDPGYESDTESKIEPKTPNSKVNSVNTECAIGKGVCVIR